MGNGGILGFGDACCATVNMLGALDDLAFGALLMALILAARVGDGFLIELPDGKTIKIIHIERMQPSHGIKLAFECDKTIKIGRTRRDRPYGSRVE